MRPLAGVATVLICAAASAAGAQTLTTSPSQSLNDSLAADALNRAAFAPRSYSADVDPAAWLLSREAYEPGAGPVSWTSGQVTLSKTPGGPVDSLRVSVGGAFVTPAGLPPSLGKGQFTAQAYEVAVTRDWPAAFSFEGKAFGLDLTPHAGVGVTNLGGSAEAGAMLQLSARGGQTMTERLKALGLRDGARFGDRGRWYLFAAASGRAVGLNMLHNDGGSWDRAGWSQDAASTLVGDAQIGVGFRKGPVQTSLGYIHREVKGQNMMYGLDSKADSMVAFSFQIRPRN